MTSSQQQHGAADRLWQRFGEMYGSRFFESFGLKPTESWIDAVKELRHDQVRGALGRIRSSGSAHPPSLPEFIALAKNIRSPEPTRHVAQTPVDEFFSLGNRWLLAFLLRKGGASADSLPKLVEMKTRIADQFRASSEACGGPTTADWLAIANAAFEKLWSEPPEQEIEAACQRHSRGLPCV